MIKFYSFVFCLVGIHVFSQENPLPPCPSSPNCFRSKPQAKRAWKNPLPFIKNKNTSTDSIKSLLDSYDNTQLVGFNGDTIHYTFTTHIGDFIDDVHFFIDEKNQCIHYRSASRVGWGDFGKNKRRMKKMAKKWLKMSSED